MGVGLSFSQRATKQLNSRSRKMALGSALSGAGLSTWRIMRIETIAMRQRADARSHQAILAEIVF